MVITLVILAFAFSLGCGILLFRQELARRQAAVEYEVFQVMTGILDRYDMHESFDPGRWPEVGGFAVYDLSGVPEYRYGSAPSTIAAAPENIRASSLSIFSRSLVMIRQTGSMPSMMGPGMRRQGMGAMNRRFMNDSTSDDDDDQSAFAVPVSPGRDFRERTNRLVYIELDVGRSVDGLRLVFVFAAVMVLLFGSILLLLMHYSRKLTAYRSREEEVSRLVQLGEAARTLAHEIKNPLGVISVQCATLNRTLPEEYHGNVGVIIEETRRLSSLADRIRDFLHSSSGNPQPFAANDFLEQCRTRYDGRVLVSSSAPMGTRVFVDPARMTQVLDNLVANAIEASSAAAPPLVSLSTARDRVLFSVVDRGVGVSPENRQRLFTLFFTTKARGSGLGLALSRRFIEQAGGTLVFEENPGGGSVFTVSLPAYDGREVK
jgi:two-component system sensor histidine kinase HydH